MTDVINLRGTGGAVWPIDWPLPGWAQEQVREGLLLPADAAAERLFTPEPVAGAVPADTLGEVEPPRAGPGSGRNAWRTYADTLGVPYDEADTRDDIVAAVDAHTPS